MWESEHWKGFWRTILLLPSFHRWVVRFLASLLVAELGLEAFSSDSEGGGLAFLWEAIAGVRQ